MLTVNVALADDARHEGGRLLALVDGPQLRRLERAEGSAVVHGGHEPSFDRERLHQLADAYLHARETA